ncbi:hypothetical protein V6N11_071596 [Hibiscus sabdariffa]|uniref:Uncharacterized protein n=1 Tax=Hibiscus sabdariffa TaxID=183260 RepID=A0ABR2U197_9ROSI
MLVCPCVTSLAGGGWFFDVLGFGQTHWDGLECSGWQNHGGAMEYRWLHLDGPGQSRRQHQGALGSFVGSAMVALWSIAGCTLVALGSLDGSTGVALGSFVGCLMVASVGCLCSRSCWRDGCPKHSCAILYPRSDMGLLCALSSLPNALACSTILGAGMLAWCAHTSMPMSLFVRPASRLFDALAAGSMLPRPVVATSGLLDCFAWHPSLVEFQGVSPFSSTWGLMLVATRAPFDCPCSFGCVRLQCVSWCYWPPIPWPRSGCWAYPGPWFALLPMLDYGASAPMVRFAPMAVVGYLRGGYSMVERLVLPLALTLDLFTDWRILYRNVPSARPRERVLSCFPSRRVLSCFPSHPFWAGYDYPRSNLCRASTSIRIDLHPYLYSHCRRHLYYALTSSCKFLSFVVCLHLLLMADSLLAQLGDLTFTAEEQDAILVAPDSVAIPAEDFACSLVVADPADPVLDPPGLASETSAQSDPAGPEVRADPNAEVRENPTVAPTATAPAAPEVRTDPTSAVRTNPTAAPVVQTGPMAPAVAAPVVRKHPAPVVRKGPAVPATAAPAVRKGQAVPATAAPMVRKGQAVPATAAPMVRKGQTVPATAATALRTDSPVPNIVAPVVRTPQRAADSPPAPSVPLETDAMVEDVVDEDSSGQNLVADGSLPDDAPYDPLVHAETSAMLEEALEISRDCVLLADMDGVLQADGEDLVNEAIPEAADSIIREVAVKILGDDAPSDGSDPPIALTKMGPSPSASPPKSGLSKSAPTGLRRAAMPVVPEHQEFDEWCAARSRTPPANVAAHPSEARASSIPPPRPHKRQAPSSDPSRAKRSRASASSSSRIPSSTKAGMSSVNNSPAETARQSRREK